MTEKVKERRKLAAIMFIDMVGYTALMQEDESKARAMRDRLRDVHCTLVAQHGGQILQLFGDGVLCSFASAIEATQCAVEIQKELRKKPEILARIGIHVGDVIFEEEGSQGTNPGSEASASSSIGSYYWCCNFGDNRIFVLGTGGRKRRTHSYSGCGFLK